MKNDKYRSNYFKRADLDIKSMEIGLKLVLNLLIDMLFSSFQAAEIFIPPGHMTALSS
jgi:hypothetical protein